MKIASHQSQKTKFLGTVASILGIPLALALYWATPSGAGGDTVNISSSRQSGGITANQVNINPSAVTTPVKEKGYVLRSKNGATLVIDSPDSGYAYAKDPNRQVCFAPAGTPVIPTERKVDGRGIKGYWREVTIIEGDCANKVGWVVGENLHWE